jgi:surface antigen
MVDINTPPTPEIPKIELDPVKQQENEQATKPTKPKPTKPTPKVVAKTPTTSPKPVKKAPTGVVVSTDGTITNLCSCVTFAKQRSGINVGSIGVARNHPINSQTPKVGGIVVLREGKVGHVAVVIGVENGSIILDEANYVHCHRTTGRTLPLDSPDIRGYFNV